MQHPYCQVRERLTGGVGGRGGCSTYNGDSALYLVDLGTNPIKALESEGFLHNSK